MITRSHHFALMVLLSAGMSHSVAPAPVKKPVLFPKATPDSLRQGWLAPPQSTKPYCYWYWLNNIVTKDGITRDLEMMAKNGLGGAYIGNVGGPEFDSPRNGRVKGYSDEWYELLQHAVREGQQLGVGIGVFNGSGWSQSGGPWVKPEDSMQFIDCTEIRVEGGTKIDQILPRNNAAVREVRVLAFPAPAYDGEALRPIRLSSPQGEELSALADGESHQLPANKNYGRVNLTWEFEAPQTVRSVLFRHHNGNKVTGRFLYSTNGTNFLPLRDFVLDRRDGPQVLLGKRPGAISTPPTTARFFRVEMPWNTARDGRDLGIQLSSAARLESAEEKQLGVASRENTPAWDHFRWPATPEPGIGAVSANRVVDLTSKMNAEGRLVWEAPAGEWVVQRYFSVSTGARTTPTAPDLAGLEIDKMSREVAGKHINQGLVGELHRRLKPSERSGFKYAIADSYEQGFQNWTAQMIPDFTARYGYDPVPWMPVLSGRIVGTAEQSDRFLWDVRRLVADLVAENYVGGLRDAVHPLGLRLWLENYGHWGFPGDFSTYGGQSDRIGGEFWNPNGLGGTEIRLATSTGHIYGKNIISAESFTSIGNQQESPGFLKARGDWAFANGINHSVLHVVSHQPTDVPGPGLALIYGTYFDRNSLWYGEHGKAWVDYLRRTSYLLQQGTPAAEVAYYIGEDSPVMTGKADPALPPGFDYDWINAEVLLKRAMVKDGRLVLQGGASYAVLAIPAAASLRPATLKKIGELVEQGLTVVGSAPSKSPSLQDYPRADAQIKKMVAELWPTKSQASRKIGKGTVWNPTDLAPVLAAKKAVPAVVESNSNVLWKQRHLSNGELFYLSNQSESQIQITPSFGVSGLAPQLWNAETAKIENLALYRVAGNRTSVPITLGPLDSVFVVFGKATTPAVTDVVRDGKPLVSWSEQGGPKVLAGEVADSNLTQSFWVKPDGVISLPAQQLGTIALDNQRWAIFPPQGTIARGEGFAGSGVSVGTNGVVVVQHWAFNAPAVLAWTSPQPLSNWTHIALSYRAGVPHLFVDGKEVAQGIRSGQRLIAGTPGEGGQTVQGSPYVNEVRGLKTSYELQSDAALAALAADFKSSTPAPPPLMLQVLRSSQNQLELRANQAGRYELKMADGRTLSAQIPLRLAPMRLDGPWNLSFSGAAAPPATTLPQLSSLSDLAGELSKYFSGNLIYDKSFDLPSNFKPDNSCVLDLGQVGIVARVAVNGQAAGTALRAPFRLEIGSLLKPGRNTLRVLVTNTWANRMIGDEQFPDDLADIRDGNGQLTQWPEWAFTGANRPDPRRITLSSRRFFRKDSALPASGLLGPVKLTFSNSVAVPFTASSTK